MTTEIVQALRVVCQARIFLEEKKFKQADDELQKLQMLLTPKFDGKLPKLNSMWGHKQCCAKENRPIFKDDGDCYCGIIKHHYHCTKCGFVTQVG
jgi:hypothetical protein